MSFARSPSHSATSSVADLSNHSEPDLAEMTDEQLLDLFLRMPLRMRDQQFIDTAKAAEIAGVTQRTIQIWIECRLIRAVRIRKRYKVSLGTLIDYLKTELGGDHDAA